MVKTSIIRAEFSPLSVARMLWKRKYSIVLIWTAVSAIGVYQVKKIPAVYRAEALVFVDSQKIPEKYVSSTVSTDVQGRFDSITQQILSRTRLTQIIRDFDLYHDQRKVSYPEEILDLMRKDISITPLSVSRSQSGAFRVAYEGRDPVVVAGVANRIANLYVEENLKTREVQAEGTSEFLDAQLQDAKKGLDEMEAAVSAFKARHNGELPQQEGAIDSALSRLQVELQANRDELNRAQESKVLLENSLSMAQETLAVQQRALEAAAAASRGAAATTAGAVAAPVRRSAELEAQLESLRTRYNDAHPEIKRMEAELRAAREEERRQPAPAPVQRAGAATHAAAPEADPIVSMQLSQARERVATLRSQITLNNKEIENRKADQRRILNSIEGYQERMGRLPLREQELARITRDYEISKANYRSLVDKRMSAEMASEMERRQKSERFTIGDTARVPDMPIRPNRKIYAAAISMFGLLLGLVWGAANELRNDVLLGEWELPPSVPVLGRVPAMELGSDEEGGGKRRLLVVSSAALSALGLLAGIYFAVYRS